VIRCHGDRTGNKAWKLAKHGLETWFDTLPGSCCHLCDGFDLWRDCSRKDDDAQVTKCKEVDQEFDAIDECSQ